MKKDIKSLAGTCLSLVLTMTPLEDLKFKWFPAPSEQFPYLPENNDPNLTDPDKGLKASPSLKHYLDSKE